VAIALLVMVNAILYPIKKPKVQFAFNILSIFLISIFFYSLFSSGFTESQSFGFALDPLSLFFMVIFGIGMMLVNALCYSSAENSYPQFALFGTFALSGMYMVSMSDNFVALALGLELMLISTVIAILASLPRHMEAAAKLFILSALSIAVLVFGIVVFYGASGTISMNGIGISQFALYSLLLIIAAIGFEIAAFPFNMWVPDVYEGSPLYITAMLGGINKKVGFLILIQVLFLAFYNYLGAILPVLYAISILTMFYGNIIALSQKSIKRMLAYSAISQSGYILIGILVGTAYGLSAALFQIVAHMFMFIGAIAIVSYMESRNKKNVSDYIGMYKENPVFAISLTVLFLSMVGIPLTSGFIGKFMLFSSAVYSNMAILAIIGIVNSVISIYYYLKVIMAAFTDKEGTLTSHPGLLLVLIVVVCTAATILLGIYPQLLIHATYAISSSIIKS
jgi:NADH-quinone oxidoreductase subunit N